MGVNLSALVDFTPISLSHLSGKIIAIDAFNTLYQFLSSIRQADGTPLSNSSGKITSHVSGLFYRSVNLLQEGIKPVFVFDGLPHPLKTLTIQKRREIRNRAMEEWEKAVKEGDMERARSKAAQSSRLTPEMVEEAKVLLELLGIPHLDAPGEGEGQASVMAAAGEAWAVGSQDFDSLLFGAPRLVRNLSLSGRRKLPRRNEYVSVTPEILELEVVLERLELTREQMIDMALLIGIDFNSGIKGIGPKTAVKLMRKHGSLEAVMQEKEVNIPKFQEIRDLFLKPVTIPARSLEWGAVDAKGCMDYLHEQFDFGTSRLESTMSKLAKLKSSRSQKSLDQWF